MAFCLSFFRLYENLALQLPKGFEAPQELIGLGLAGDGSFDIRLSGRLRRAIAERSRTIEAVEAVMYVDGQSVVGPETSSERIGIVTEGFFGNLGVRMRLGPGFRAGNREEGVILDQEYWQRAFGADPEVLGKRIAIQGSTFEVVGVAHPDFKGTHRGPAASIWVPLQAFAASVWNAQPDVIAERFRMVSVGRLAPSQSVDAARIELRSLTREMRSEFRDDLLGLQLIALEHLAPDPERHASAIRHIGLMVVAATAVLLIASGNLGLFFLGRVPQRQREMGIRLSLGATQGQLARQLLTESAVLVSLGISLGMMGQFWLTETLRALPFFSGVIWQEGSALDWPVAVYVAALGLFAAALVGVAPAVDILRRSVVERTRQFPARVGTAQRLVVGSQIALGGLALSTAVFFVQNTLRNSDSDVGYSAEGVQIVQVVRADADWSGDASSVSRLRDDIAARVEATGQIESIGFGGTVPGVAPPATFVVRVVDGFNPEIASQMARVAPTWFNALGVGVLRGQLPDPNDGGAVVVNASFANSAWGTLDVVGKRVRAPVAFSPAGGAGEVFSDLTVMAVVDDVQFGTPGQLIGPVMFVNQPVASDIAAFIVVKGGLSARATEAALASLFDELAAPIQVARVFSLERQVDVLVAPERARATLIGVAGGFAAVLAVLGFLGSVRFVLGNAQWEFALRSALGADDIRLRREMLRRALALGIPGLVLGLSCAPIVLGYIALYFGLWRADPVLPVVICATVLLVTLGLSAWFPATRAARISPAEVLKAD